MVDNRDAFRPTPGTIVQITGGPFEGLFGSVALGPVSATQPGTVPVFFDEPEVRLGWPTQLVYLQPEHLRALEGVWDPWHEKFRAWAQSNEGRRLLTSSALTTSEILEVLGLPDGFGSQVRATKILVSLKCQKLERVRGAWVWQSLEEETPPASEKFTRRMAPNGMALILALNYFIAWLRMIPAAAQKLFENVAMVCVRHGKEPRPDLVKWMRQGGAVLSNLGDEIGASEINGTSALILELVKLHASGRVPGALSADEFHRLIAHELARARRFRLIGFSPCLHRTPEVNGWLLALQHMIPMAVHDAAKAMEEGDELTSDAFTSQAEALQWIIDAIGGGPNELDEVIPPRAKLLGLDIDHTRRALDLESATNWAMELLEGPWEELEIEGRYTQALNSEQRILLERKITAALMTAAHGYAPTINDTEPPGAP